MSKYFPEDQAVTEARSKDPLWQQENARKVKAAAEAFAQRRADINQPLAQKKAHERF